VKLQNTKEKEKNLKNNQGRKYNLLTREGQVD
jgi:hypothetical protein